MDILNILTTFALQFNNNRAKVRKKYLRTKENLEKVMLEVKNLTKKHHLTRQMSQKRYAMVSEISEGIREKIYESSLECDCAFGSFPFPSGVIEVEVNRNGEVYVCVSHKENDHASPTLEALIADCIPDWYDVEAEAKKDLREEEEFRDYLWRNCRYW